MVYRAKANFLRVSPQKLRVIVDLVRGKKAGAAIDILTFDEHKWAKQVAKLVRSAVSNASQNRGVDVDTLYIKTITVDQAPTFKRMMTRARGSSAGILKRNSNLTVILDERK